MSGIKSLARLVIVAAVGAGLVLGVQGLTAGGGGGSHSSATTRTTLTPAPGAALADRAPAGAQRPGAPAAGSAATPAPATPTAAVTAAATLGRTAVTGPGLAVVVDDSSGPLAQQNRLISQGATVALDQLNAGGGIGHRPVRIVHERLAGLSPSAVQARLRAAGHGAVLVLPCDTNSEPTLAAGAAPFKTLMLAPCAPDASTARRIGTYWPVGMTGSDEAAGLAAFVRAEGYASTFIITTPGLGYGGALTGYFRTAAQARGIRIVGEGTVSLRVGDAEVKRLAGAIAAARPQPATLFSALPPPYVNRLATALAGDGVHATLIGTSAMDTPLTLSSGTAGLGDAILPSYGFLRQIPAVSQFVAAYRKRFGPPVGAFPGLGFETIGVLEDAIAKARSTEPAAIQQALLGGIHHVGVALTDRSYRGGADHSPVTTVSIEKISAGAFLPLLTSSPPAGSGPAGSPPAA